MTDLWVSAGSPLARADKDVETRMSHIDRVAAHSMVSHAEQSARAEKTIFAGINRSTPECSVCNSMRIIVMSLWPNVARILSVEGLAGRIFRSGQKGYDLLDGLLSFCQSTVLMFLPYRDVGCDIDQQR